MTTNLVRNVSAESRFVQYDKPFAFRCDESVGRGGGDEAPSPLRYFLSGIGFCLQVWYAKGAALHEVEVEDLTVEVSTYMDMRGEHLVGDVVPHPQWIAVEADFRSPSDAASVLAAVDEGNRRCPVSALVSRAVPVNHRVVLNGAIVRDEVPSEWEAFS